VEQVADISSEWETYKRPSDKLPPSKLGDPVETFKNRTTRDLLRSYFVFRLCSLDFIVKHQFKLLSWARRVLGQRLYKRMLQATVYGQFMAGENRDEVLQCAEKHWQAGIMPMFAYTAAEIHGIPEQGDSEENKRKMKALWQTNFEAVMESIDHAALARGHRDVYTRATNKLTCMASAELLTRLTDIVNENSYFLKKFKRKWGQGDHSMKKEFDIAMENMWPEVVDTACSLGLNIPMDSAVENLDIDHLSTSLAWQVAVSRNKHFKNKFRIHRVVSLDSREFKRLLELVHRYSAIFEKAAARGVCVNNDAEQSYLQDGIDVITLDLMRIYNKTRPVVLQTYQCYRTRTLDLLKRDLNMAKREQFCLGAKVVRGGYMEEERKLAAEKSYPDPINPTYEATTQMYQDVTTELLTRIRHSRPGSINVIFATHNEDSVKFVIQKAEEIGVPLDPNMISFAQLLGMRDHIAFPLGQAGYPSSKLLHYGPVEQGVAYLSRRMQENKSIMPTANLERKIMSSELKRRLTPFKA